MSKSQCRLEPASIKTPEAGDVGEFKGKFSHMVSSASQREFLPAAGRDVFLPLYDPMVRLLGFGRAAHELISQANVEPGQRVLDVGCGTGTLVVMLKRQFSNVQVVGLDPDAKALRRAQSKVRRAAVSVQLDEGFSDNLSYQDGSFDRVFCSFMFHHLDEQQRERTSREVLRVLKPGGSFHLLDFVSNGETHGFFERLMAGHALMKTNTNERILKLMRRAGFTNVMKVKESSMLFGVMRTSYFRAAV